MQNSFTFSKLKRAIEAARGSSTAAILLLTLQTCTQTYPLVQSQGVWYLPFKYVDICHVVGLTYDQVRYGMRKLRELQLITIRFIRGNDNMMHVALTDKARGLLK